MGAHVFIVTTDTFPIVKNRGIAAVISEDPSKMLSEKTRADILADISCIRKGDRIFFYEIEYNGQYLFGNKNNPHFIKGSLIFPNRILIMPKIYLEKSINEWRNASRSAFGRFTSAIDLRSIFYKKVLGRGKSITHLFPEEENKLTELLMKVNNGKESELMYIPYKSKKPQPIIFDLTPTSQSEVKYEKILEGWIIQNIDNPSANTEQFLGDIEEIECFANYVPVSIAGGNLDIVVFHRKKDSGERYKITIIELKKGEIGKDDIEQLENYVKWAAENLTKVIAETPSKIEIDLLNKMDIVQPVIIGKGISESALEKCKDYSLKYSKLIVIIEYDLDYKNYKINFNRLTY